ncbi:LysR family transcriptional regulator [Cronobacter sakazakii]|uniref:LysR family transcriptional regulator n=1 Tax=Cronobacter sakazakii TaxID=28141 RepID=UPI0028961986|nr:LysR family transcriptional regulator [Cronobacter sakazakii]MDT3546006.1 LysR family transcriptional regulator [Cronobacter sakazakii]
MTLTSDVHRLLPAFLAAAQSQSFSAAARLLGVTPAAVSKSVRQLEARLGRVLFQRNTHFVVLTEEGAALREQVAPLWHALNQALEKPADEPQGLVRVSVIPGFGRYLLMPELPAFQQRYPQVRLDLAMDPRRVNLIGERIDVAIGQRTVQDSRVVTREIRPMRMMLAASPAYLAQFGTPQQPQDLLHHRCLVHRNPGNGKLQSRLTDELAMEEQHAFLISTFPDVLVDAALAEMGIVSLADWYLAPLIATGRLVPLMEAHWPAPQPLWVKYPHHRLAPRVRAFVDFLVEKFTV